MNNTTFKHTQSINIDNETLESPKNKEIRGDSNSKILLYF